MVIEKGEKWKKIGIYDMILLSKKEISLKFKLLYDFLSFWNTSMNAFCLLFGMMSLMLLDVAAIIGLPMDEDEVPFFHDALDNNLGFQINKNNNAYSTFINTFNKGSVPIGKIEHKAFLLFWICYFFVCTSSVVVVGEFALYILDILN